MVAKRSYLRQSDMPNVSLDEALRLPEAIFDHYAAKPTTPFNVAKVLNVDPKGSQLRLLSGAAIAFGLIEGGAQASNITVTETARKIIRPKIEDEDLLAKREALLRPRVFREFLEEYNGNQLPRADIAFNVIESMGVPREKTSEVYDRIVEGAKSVGLIEEIKGKAYVQLSRGTFAHGEPEIALSTKRTEDEVADEPPYSERNLSRLPVIQTKGASLIAAFADDQRRRRVFITHGKDRAFVDPIKKLLEYGELDPIVAAERQSVSKPVPEKIMDDMRRCGAAIIHVDAEKILKEGEIEHVIINPNVLIEIGAAMAFYGRRFILLVRDGVKLPSNLQGLYEVRYSSDTLDAVATIKLLEAMKDVKNYPLPSDSDDD